MKSDQIQFLEANKHYWETYKKDQVIKHYDQSTRKAMFQIARTFNPKVNFCLHCNDDVANMLKYVYTQYEKMGKETENNLEEGVKKMTFPRQEPEEAQRKFINIDTAENSKINKQKKRGRKPKIKTDAGK